MKTTPSELVAAEIRAELARRRMSQTDLADKLGVSRPWVARRISAAGGTTAITVDDIDRIARALEVAIEQLVSPIDEQRLRQGAKEQTA